MFLSSGWLYLHSLTCVILLISLKGCLSGWVYTQHLLWGYPATVLPKINLLWVTSPHLRCGNNRTRAVCEWALSSWLLSCESAECRKMGFTSWGWLEVAGEMISRKSSHHSALLQLHSRLHLKCCWHVFFSWVVRMYTICEVLICSPGSEVWMVAVGGQGGYSQYPLSWRCQNTGLGEGVKGEENIILLCSFSAQPGECLELMPALPVLRKWKAVWTNQNPSEDCPGAGDPCWGQNDADPPVCEPKERSGGASGGAATPALVSPLPTVLGLPCCQAIHSGPSPPCRWIGMLQLLITTTCVFGAWIACSQTQCSCFPASVVLPFLRGGCWSRTRAVQPWWELQQWNAGVGPVTPRAVQG